MRTKTLLIMQRVFWLGALSFAGFVPFAQGSDGVWLATNAVAAFWQNPSNWVGGTIAGNYGQALIPMTAYVTDRAITNSETVSLGGLKIRFDLPATNMYRAYVNGGEFAFSDGAVIDVAQPGDLFLNGTRLSGSGDLVFSGGGRTFIGEGTNTYAGRTIVSNGWLRAKRDTALGVLPATPRADAIVLDGGTLMNDDNVVPLQISTNRGITVTQRGGYITAGYSGATAYTMVYSVITGLGSLGFIYENSPVILLNPGNDYAGDTVIGTTGPGSVNGMRSRLRLGADEVLPHGEGKGRLVFGAVPSNSGYELDLNGFTETVNALVGDTKNAVIKTSVKNAGHVHVLSDVTYAGQLENGATLTSSGTLTLVGTRSNSGIVEVGNAVVMGSASLFPWGTLRFTGGTLTLTNQPGWIEYQGAVDGNSNVISLNAALAYLGVKSTADWMTTIAGNYPVNTQFSYQGRWYAPITGTYSFAGSFDDGTALIIDGQVLFNTNNVTKVVKQNVALVEGWHDVDMRVANKASAGGPLSGFSSGILFSTNNSAFATVGEISAGLRLDVVSTSVVPTNRPNYIFGRMLMEQSGTLNVKAAALGEPVFAGILESPASQTLTLGDWSSPLMFGSPLRGYPALYNGTFANVPSLILTNSVWLKKIPEAYVIRPQARIALDGVKLADSQVVDGFTLVYLSTTPALASLTVQSGSVLDLSTLCYADLAYSNAPLTFTQPVTLNNGTMTVAAAGDVTLNAAISGSGNIEHSGSAKLILQNNAISTGVKLNTATDSSLIYTLADLTYAAPIGIGGGGIHVASNTTLTASGCVSRYLNRNGSKWGEGKLILSGTEQNNGLSLHGRGGVIELNKSGAATNYAVASIIGIESNALFRLTGSNGNQIEDTGRVQFFGGYLDLNGLSESVGYMTNSLPGGGVINNGARDATIAVIANADTELTQSQLKDGSAVLHFTKEGTGLALFGADTMRYTGTTTVNGGTLKILTSTNVTATLVRFNILEERIKPDGVVEKTSPDYYNSGFQFAEFQLTLNGVGITNDVGTLTYAPKPRAGNENYDKVVDNNLATKWYTSSTNDSRDNPLTITYPGVRTFNGYRWSTANDAPGRDPISWTFEVGYVTGNTTNWFLLDQKTRYATTTARQTYTPAFPVMPVQINSIPDAQPIVIGSNGRLLLENLAAPETLSNLSGSGTLEVNNGTVILTNPERFNGSVIGTGTVILETSSEQYVDIRPGGAVISNAGERVYLRNALGGTNMWSTTQLKDGVNPIGLQQTAGTTIYSGNATYSGNTLIDGGQAVIARGVQARYIRFTPLLMNPSGSNYSSNNYQIAEFRLMLSGSDLMWPSNTTAYGEIGSGSNSAELAPNAVDNKTNNKFYSAYSAINPLVIVLPAASVFDGYTYYTGNDSTGRDPVKWTLETSLDKVTWTVVDIRSNQVITTTRNARAGNWLLPNLAVTNNAFSDASRMTVNGQFALLSQLEVVGPLSGTGQVALVSGTLGVNSFADAAFSGTLVGTGVVSKTGSAVQTFSGTLAYAGTLIVESGTLNLDHATLNGVTNIVLRGGVLTGTATVLGPLTMTNEGGIYDAQLAVSGALTIVGDLKVRAEGVSLPYTKELFSYASIDADSAERVRQALMTTALPEGVVAHVSVTASQAKLIVVKSGSVILVR